MSNTDSPMKPIQLFLLTVLAMIAFAANSVICRLALKETTIDAASFTAIRIASGALILWLIIRFRDTASSLTGGNWPSALALFGYAAAFSFAYANLETGVGALLLFGAVQATMILTGLWQGERLRLRQTFGLTVALLGLVILLLPGLAAPPLAGAILMLGAGICWGIYSLRGRGAANPIAVTGGNFMRAAPLAITVSIALLPWANMDTLGTFYAVLSGAVASGLGYVVWYTALRGLNATQAATVQLSVPIIAALGGIALLAEPVTWRLAASATLVLGGIALVIHKPKEPIKKSAEALTTRKT